MKPVVKKKKTKNIPAPQGNLLTYISLMVVLIMTFFAYQVSLSNGFINMDDGYSILGNPDIRDLSGKGLSHIFQSYNLGMYAPITQVLYALVFAIAGLSPLAFHISGLLLHLANIFILFWIAKKISGQESVALVCCLLFALHPIQTEAVCWPSALSTLLYAFFYLLSIFFYLRFQEGQKRGWYLLCLLFFLLSILSKSSAVTLPLLLIGLDYFQNKAITQKSLLTKTPFFLLSLAFGVLTFYSRNAEGANIHFSDTGYTLFERLLMVSYTPLFYLFKLIIPIGFSFLYPFPNSGSFTWIFWVSPLVWVAIAVGLWKSDALRKIFSFGILMFLIPLLVMLPLIKVGSQEMCADRYVYLSSIGVFILIGFGVQKLVSQNSKNWILLALIPLGLILGYLTHVQSLVWKDDISLYSDVIAKQPNAATAYNNRGNAYLNMKKYDLAYSDFSKNIELEPRSAVAFNNRGIAAEKNKNLQGAIADYTRSIELDTAYSWAYYNRASARKVNNDLEGAISDYTAAIRLDPSYKEAFYNRARTYSKMNKVSDALSDYTKAITLDHNYAESYHNRGILYMQINNTPQAFADFLQAVTIKPDYTDAYNSLGNAYADVKNYSEAISNYNKAIELNPGYAEAIFNRGSVWFDMKKYENALSDFKKASSMGYPAQEAIQMTEQALK